MANMEGFLLINIYALVLIITIGIVFFTKQRLNQSEDKIYGKFLIYSIMMNLSGLILGFLVVPDYNIPIVIQLVFNKIYLIALLLWINTLTLYTFYVSMKNKKNFDKYIRLFKIFDLINIFMAIVLPLSISMQNGSAVPEGLVYMYSYSIFCLEFLFQIICVIRHPKNIKNKKFIPLYVLSTFGTGVMINQIINPDMNYLINPVFIFIAIVMYFTIENPDVKVINELNRNKDILEKNNENSSNFLFKMTQEVRKPINNIDELANMIDTEKEYIKLEDVVNAIKSNTRQISYIVNDVLDVTDIDIRKIKITNTKYNVKRLFEEINLFIKDKIPVNVTYNNSLSSEIPEFLYGDYIKLKQAIMSILINSCQNTKKGFIDLDVSTIIKYDMCRLIITIEDSGVGMNINKVNSILTLDKTLDEKDEARLEKMDVDLNITKKIINIIGGSIMISSEVDKGSEFIVVVDQRIAKDNAKEIKTDSSKEKIRVLIVDDDLDLLNKEKSIFEKNDIQIIGTMYGMDCVNRIRLGEKFDYIILDDATVKGSAKETLDELSNISNFNIPVIVMLEENKEKIKNHYLEIGFEHFILKNGLEENLQKFIDKIK